MSIYTKKGDTGTTSLFGGVSIEKDDIQVEAYGSLDELSSFIGLAIAKLTKKEDIRLLTNIQSSLYEIMSVLAGYNKPIESLAVQVKQFEQFIDTAEFNLPELTHFILPQGGEISSLFHVIRTLTRKSERKVVSLFHTKKVATEDKAAGIMQYLNRLSDLFFILARTYEEKEEIVIK
ncbi:cob(I)yrinic acid a,c-diamide adenosyltransferase [Candidatus Roizmanbacteria bacterium]|nr:cob(I)yrinic acid a,c-diamide adenosyltransferase [Candidatus Roizmanbacteria bacterium]